MEYLVKGVLFSAYLYIHANYCLVCCHFSSTRLCTHTKNGYKDNQNFFLQYRLPWDSPLTWVIAAFAIDFCYYWVHRSAHGKSFLLVVLFMIVYWLYYLCITCYLFWVRRSAYGKCLSYLSFSYSFVLYNFSQSLALKVEISTEAVFCRNQCSLGCAPGPIAVYNEDGYNQKDIIAKK